MVALLFAKALAYTTTTKGTSATLVGTSGNDSSGAIAAALTSITVNSFEGDDTLTTGANTLKSDSSIGMGAGVDTVDARNATVFSGTVTLGDAKDNYLDSGSDQNVTVGGQGGADSFVLTGSDRTSGGVRYAGGQGTDSFAISGAYNTGTSATIVGGSEDDTVTTTAAATLGDDATSTAFFFNGQKGKDKFTTTGDISIEDATIRGGSEADTINISSVVTAGNIAGKVEIYGDAGADTLTGSSGAESIFGGGGADRIDANAGTDYIGLGEGTDTFITTTGDGGDATGALTGAQCLAQSGTMTGLTAEVVADFSGSDKLTAIGGTAKSFQVALTKADNADGTAYFVRGTYNSTLQTFALSSTGNDVLLSTDAAGGTDDAVFAAQINEYTVFTGAASASAFFG